MTQLSRQGVVITLKIEAPPYDGNRNANASAILGIFTAPATNDDETAVGISTLPVDRHW